MNNVSLGEFVTLCAMKMLGSSWIVGLDTWSHQGYWRPPRAPPPRPYGKSFQPLTQNRVGGRLVQQNIPVIYKPHVGNWWKLITTWFGMEGSYFWNLIVVKRPHTLWSMEPLAKAYYLDAIVMRHISLNQAPAVGMQKKELGACFATGNTFQTFLEPFNLALVIGLIGWPSCLRLRPVSTIRPEEATVEHRQRVGKWNSMKFRKPPVSKLLWKGSAFAVPLCKKAGEVCGKA